MPTETVRVTVAHDEYTLIGDGVYKIAMRPHDGTNFRLVIAPSLPAAGTVDYFPITVSGFALTDLEAADKVYLLADGGADCDVAVMRG